MLAWRGAFGAIGIFIVIAIGVEGNLFADSLALGMTLCMAAMMVIARRFRDIPTLHI